MINHTPPVQQDYRQLYDGPEPCQLAQLQQARPAQLTLPGLEPTPQPATPPRPTITIEWPGESAASDLSDNVLPDKMAGGVSDSVPDNGPDTATDNSTNDEPEATNVSGFLFVVKWGLVAALILAGFISYL